MTSVDKKELKQFTNRYVNMLADSVASDFADYVSQHEDYATLIHDVAAEFIEERLPIIEEDSRFDVACAIMDKVYMTHLR